MAWPLLCQSSVIQGLVNLTCSYVGSELCCKYLDSVHGQVYKFEEFEEKKTFISVYLRILAPAGVWNYLQPSQPSPQLSKLWETCVCFIAQAPILGSCCHIFFALQFCLSIIEAGNLFSLFCPSPSFRLAGLVCLRQRTFISVLLLCCHSCRL